MYFHKTLNMHEQKKCVIYIENKTGLMCVNAKRFIINTVTPDLICV